MKDKDTQNMCDFWQFNMDSCMYLLNIYENSSTNHPVNVFALLKGLVQGLGVSDDTQVKIFGSLK